MTITLANTSGGAITHHPGGLITVRLKDYLCGVSAATIVADSFSVSGNVIREAQQKAVQANNAAVIANIDAAIPCASILKSALSLETNIQYVVLLGVRTEGDPPLNQRYGAGWTEHGIGAQLFYQETNSDAFTRYNYNVMPYIPNKRIPHYKIISPGAYFPYFPSTNRIIVGAYGITGGNIVFFLDTMYLLPVRDTINYFKFFDNYYVFLDDTFPYYPSGTLRDNSGTYTTRIQDEAGAPGLGKHSLYLPYADKQGSDTWAGQSMMDFQAADIEPLALDVAGYGHWDGRFGRPLDPAFYLWPVVGPHLIQTHDIFTEDFKRPTFVTNIIHGFNFSDFLDGRTTGFTVSPFPDADTVVNGVLCIVFATWNQATGTQNVTGPAGWTRAAQFGDNSLGCAVFWKVLNGTEAGVDQTFTFAASAFYVSEVVFLANVDVSNPIAGIVTNTAGDPATSLTLTGLSISGRTKALGYGALWWPTGDIDNPNVYVDPDASYYPEGYGTGAGITYLLSANTLKDQIRTWTFDGADNTDMTLSTVGLYTGGVGAITGGWKFLGVGIAINYAESGYGVLANIDEEANNHGNHLMPNDLAAWNHNVAIRGVGYTRAVCCDSKFKVRTSGPEEYFMMFGRLGFDGTIHPQSAGTPSDYNQYLSKWQGIFDHDNWYVGNKSNEMFAFVQELSVFGSRLPDANAIDLAVAGCHALYHLAYGATMMGALQVTAGGAMNVRLFGIYGANYGQPTFVSGQSWEREFGAPVSTGMTFSPGTVYRLKVERRLYQWKVKAWADGTTEPDWQLIGYAPNLVHYGYYSPTYHWQDYPYEINYNATYDSQYDWYQLAGPNFNDPVPCFGYRIAPDGTLIAPIDITFTSWKLSYPFDDTSGDVYLHIKKYDNSIDYGTVTIPYGSQRITMLHGNLSFNGDSHGLNYRMWKNAGASDMMACVVSDIWGRVPPIIPIVSFSSIRQEELRTVN